MLHTVTSSNLMLCYFLFQIPGCAHPNVLSQLNISNTTCENVIIDHVSNHHSTTWQILWGTSFLRAMNLLMNQKCKFASRFHSMIVRCMRFPVNSLVKVIINLIFSGINFAIFWNLWNWKKALWYWLVKYYRIYS